MNALPRLLSAALVATLLALLALASMGRAQAQAQVATPFKPVPPYAARVTDQIGMLTDDQRQQLEHVLADYEARTGSQIAVLLVASTEPEAIEQYSIRVTDAWKLGRKGIDDGVLLLVARDNPKALRRLRIEAGRGVQGVLTDAQSKRILQDTIAPHFRQDDWYGGLVAGVGAIATLLNQEKFPAPKARAAPDDGGGPGIVVSLVTIIVGIVIIASLYRPRRQLAQPGAPGTQGATDWNSGATGFIIGNILGNMSAHDNERWRGGGGFSDSGGSSSGGGFDGGGGGGFDGGGASGDW